MDISNSKMAIDADSPAMRNLVDGVSTLEGVMDFYIMDHQGSIVIQSTAGRNVGDLLTYCIVSGIRIRNALEKRGPRRIWFTMESGDNLIIIPGKKMILAFFLLQGVSVSNTVKEVQGLLAEIA